MVVWTANIPAANHTLAADQPVMENNNAYLNSVVAVDHNVTNNSTNGTDGYHKVIRQIQQGGDPAAIASIGQIYNKSAALATDSGSSLFFRTGPGAGGIITQLTAPIQSVVSAANSVVFIPGGLIMICGQFTQTLDPQPYLFLSGGGWGNGFPTNCFGVHVTCMPAAPLAPDASWAITAFSKTGFTLATSGINVGKLWFFTAYGN